jgi:hypothetical protein
LALNEGMGYGANIENATHTVDSKMVQCIFLIETVVLEHFLKYINVTNLYMAKIYITFTRERIRVVINWTTRESL